MGKKYKIIKKQYTHKIGKKNKAHYRKINVKFPPSSNLKSIINIHKATWGLGYWNNAQLFKKLIFTNNLIRKTIKNGNVLKSYNILESLARKVKKKYKLSIFDFMSSIYDKIVPVVGFRNWHLGKIKYKVPYYNLDNEKQSRLATTWFNNSIKKSYKTKINIEKRFIEEMTSIYENDYKSSGTLKKKKNITRNFLGIGVLLDF